ncbi:MAG: aldehyde dehydrogenase (NADP(+)) [Pirellulaceae bacterium]|nr:aldehyde dehydrogenase (NADP(+)) [Planctomycetales bacterium]
MAVQKVLLGGQWVAADSSGTFTAENPRTGEALADSYPVSSWSDCDKALHAAREAFDHLRTMPRDQIAQFLEKYAELIEQRKDSICALAAEETALPVSPRLADVELPRTTNQLRQAAAACRNGSWALPTIDTKANIRSCLAAIGPVVVFGPNNFPLAFNGVSGGDFAAAVAAGCPVIAKSNSLHPGTTRLLAEAAHDAACATNMPAGTIQLLYRLDHADGERLVADRRIGATGYTGSRSAGLKLKAAADAAGKPIYLELSSVNPVVILPGALRERGAALADEFASSCLMGTGQFCTNPGLIVLVAGQATEDFVAAVGEKFAAAPVGTLLSRGGARSLAEAIEVLKTAGAAVVAGGEGGGGTGASYQNTWMRINGDEFLQRPHLLQTEAFGNASLCVVAGDIAEVKRILDQLEGNLTGCIYSHTQGEDDADYAAIEPHLRQHVGRLLNDKMPTGVAVSPAMNHGGPFPSTGHPGFTAVGIPASLRRFAMLQCYDNVRPSRLPELLLDDNPLGATRFVDGQARS